MSAAALREPPRHEDRPHLNGEPPTSVGDDGGTHPRDRSYVRFTWRFADGATVATGGAHPDPDFIRTVAAHALTTQPGGPRLVLASVEVRNADSDWSAVPLPPPLGEEGGT